MSPPAPHRTAPSLPSPLLCVTSGKDMPAPVPSTATTGFFQPAPSLPNPATSRLYARLVGLLVPPAHHDAVQADLLHLGDVVLSPQVASWIADSEANPPVLHLRDTFGAPLNRLVTSEGWRRLQDLGLSQGMVATGYERQYGSSSRLVQALRLMLWNPSASTVTCPSAMQDGAAALLEKHLRGNQLDGPTRAVLQSAWDRLTSRKLGFAWTAGQWMTERTGGSDVQGTETRAHLASQDELHYHSDHVASDGHELGPWVIDGFKWFSSATDSDMTLLLAKTPGADTLSCFFAPTRIKRRHAVQTGLLGPDARLHTEFNGILPQRLKNKLGTRALPTAELELRGMRAYLVGELGAGVREISTVLTLTRIYNAVTGIGDWARGLAVATAYSQVRTADKGRLLSTIPAHVKTLADMHSELAGHAMLACFTAHCLGVVEVDRDFQPTPTLASTQQATRLLRLLTPVAKATTALATVASLRACMESLGGIGYLENDDTHLNIARLFRNDNVLPIWEGTTNIQAADMVRVLQGRDGDRVLGALDEWLHLILNSSAMPTACIHRELGLVKRAVAGEAGAFLYHGSSHLERLGWIVGTALLVHDASRADADAVAVELAARWLSKRDDRKPARTWQDLAAADAAIVYGYGQRSGHRSRL